MQATIFFIKIAYLPDNLKDKREQIKINEITE